MAAFGEIPVGTEVVGDKVLDWHFSGGEGIIVGGAARLDDVEDDIIYGVLDLDFNFLEFGIVSACQVGYA